MNIFWLFIKSLIKILKRSEPDSLVHSFQVDLYLDQDSWYSFSTCYDFTQVIILQQTFLRLVHKVVKDTLSNSVMKAFLWSRLMNSIKMSLECPFLIASTDGHFLSSVTTKPWVSYIFLVFFCDWYYSRMSIISRSNFSKIFKIRKNISH